MNAFRLSGPPMILDGGLATELEAQGHDLSDALWSARLLADAPEEIVAAHAAFFRAGAAIATTASYQASFEGFAERGIERTEAAKLMRRSVELARLAGEVEPGRHRWVAASIGPYGAVLADGSEYRGRYGLTKRELHDFHRPRLEVLAEACPDVFALETIPDIDEAEALVEAVADLDIPAWLSFTISGEQTRAGQPLANAFEAAAGSDAVIAVGVNCSAPDDVLSAIETARAATEKPIVVYPNSGEGWDAQRRAWTGRSRVSVEQARSWRAAGAQVIGGCCRVRPEDIAAVADALTDPAA
ncbi:homocysteine S-methyltransferase [Saccharopolyspora phatthalungensis]|uniref:S-methylmethionine:homocysteine methyltransferase n=1 Tax=Saccharopolyspora phatthalungensis TaxID=664693 RepID=A0A840QGC1_9PSEU|nr:homocysteine S-methyltransferase [Saccharopolyspora phatthalungensis]MBB5156203.1 homocysteine S-methyltransferase [Saccharopolyspora phatthalungensis]